jgi:hypothetical protein
MQERERERERDSSEQGDKKTIIHVPFFSCLTSHLLPLSKTTVNTHSSHYNNIFLLSTVRTNLLYQQSCISFTRNHLHRDKHHWERERENYDSPWPILLCFWLKWQRHHLSLEWPSNPKPTSQKHDLVASLNSSICNNLALHNTSSRRQQ